MSVNLVSRVFLMYAIAFFFSPLQFLRSCDQHAFASFENLNVFWSQAVMLLFEEALGIKKN